MGRDFDRGDRSDRGDYSSDRGGSGRGSYRGGSSSSGGGDRADIKPRVIYTVTETDKYAIRVVQWLKNGSPVGRPQLEKREIYQDREGNQKTGKVKGFALDDLELVRSNWAAVKDHMGKSTPARGESRGESRAKPPKETKMDDEDDMPTDSMMDDMQDDAF